jgi:hypothetical protein
LRRGEIVNKRELESVANAFGRKAGNYYVIILWNPKKSVAKMKT